MSVIINVDASEDLIVLRIGQGEPVLLILSEKAINELLLAVEGGLHVELELGTEACAYAVGVGLRLTGLDVRYYSVYLCVLRWCE